MPLLSATRLERGGIRTELIGIKEEGGLIVRVSDVSGEIVLDARAGILEGVVVDSTGGAPVTGAVVFLDQTDQDTTDDAGRFRFTSLPAGSYGLSVYNPALDALGLKPPTTYAESIPGDVSSVRLEFPGVVSALTAVCGPHEPRVGGGIITGHMRHASGEPAPGALIKIGWQEIRAMPGGFQSQQIQAEVDVAREDGFYAACGLPRDRWLQISVEWDDFETRSERWRFPGMTVVAHKDMTAPTGR
jgi:hypothetical protein